MDSIPNEQTIATVYTILNRLNLNRGQSDRGGTILHLLGKHENPLLIAEMLKLALGPVEDIGRIDNEELQIEYTGDLYNAIFKTCKTIIKYLGIKGKTDERADLLARICACRYQNGAYGDVESSAEIFEVEVWQYPVYMLYQAFVGGVSAQIFTKIFFHENKKKRDEQ